MNERTFLASKAHRLEDPQRLIWLPPAAVIDALALTPGMVVADVGAGTGHFALPLAEEWRGLERVYAVDFQPEMLRLLESKLSPASEQRIERIEASAEATQLPVASCDRVLLANIWHELDNRERVMQECRRVLRVGGRIAIVDWRHDMPSPPGPPVEHRIAREAVEAELAAAGWRQVHGADMGTFSYLVTAELP